jgi:hypothetical protein
MMMAKEDVQKVPALAIRSSGFIIMIESELDPSKRARANAAMFELAVVPTHPMVCRGVEHNKSAVFDGQDTKIPRPKRELHQLWIGSARGSIEPDNRESRLEVEKHSLRVVIGAFVS